MQDRWIFPDGIECRDATIQGLEQQNAGLRERLREAEAAERQAGARVKSTHRHKKRGTEYALLGYGRMQSEFWEERGEGTTDCPAPIESVDMREVAIYQSVDDGSLWVRPLEEFDDGRFEALTTEATNTGGGDA